MHYLTHFQRRQKVTLLTDSPDGHVKLMFSALSVVFLARVMTHSLFVPMEQVKMLMVTFLLKYGVKQWCKENLTL